MFCLRLLSCLLLLTSLLPAQPISAENLKSAKSQPLIISEGLKCKNLTPYLEYYEDTKGDISIENISQKKHQFLSARNNKESFGYTQNPIWLRFTVLNNGPDDISWFLEHTYPLIDKIELYTPIHGTKKFSKFITGDTKPFNSREFNFRTFVFNINTSPGYQQIYMKIESKGALYASLKAWNKKTFYESMINNLAIHWIFCGLLIALAVYHLFIFLMVKESSYLYLTCFTISMMIYSLIHNGLAFKYLWPNHVFWANICHPFFIAIASLLFILFSRIFLNTKKHCPAFDKFLIVLAVLNSLTLVMVFYINYFYMTQISIFFCFITVFTLLFAGIVLYLNGLKSAFFYSSAIITLVVACSLTIMNVYGLVGKSFLSTWSAQIGCSLFVLILSFGVGDKMKIIQLEKQRVLKELREANEKYKILVENANEGIVLRREDIQVYANKAAFDIVGYTEKEFYRKEMLDFFPDNQKGKILITERSLKLQKGEALPNKYEAQIQKLNGEIIDVIISDTPVSIDGDTAILSIITDISDRIKAEAKIQQQKNQLKKHRDNLEKTVRERTAELEDLNVSLNNAKIAAELAANEAKEANTAKSTFLANMSHEIRTPLNAVIGMAELVLTTPLTDKQKEYMGIILSSSNSLLQLINDILDFSKIDAGKLDFENIHFRLGDVIDEVTDMFIEKSITREIELIVDIAENVPQELIADSFRLKQVISNLLSNAFKFTQNGEVLIKVSKNSESAENVELLFCVKDSGIGIKEHSIDHLFDVFQQADDSTTRKYGGTGLGLAICKKIVKLFKGKIWVESIPGKGSSFYFTAFFKRSFQLDENAGRNIPPTFKDSKVLIVDDNASTLLVLKRIVESFGFQTILTSSGESAIQIYKGSLENDKIEIIMMDNRLRGIGGIEAAKTIIEMTDKPPAVIIISAYGSAEEITRAKESGIDYFISKPVKQSQLFDTIMTIYGFEPKYGNNSKLLNDNNMLLNNLNILLVEDNPINQLVAEEMLSSLSINVEIVGNGREAVEALSEKIYDLVIMDVQMPEMDGLDATKKIRKDLKLTSIPIIAMTAHAMYGDKENCLKAGMNDYLPKPISRNELIKIIKKNISVQNSLSSLTNSAQTSLSYTIPGFDLEEALKNFNGSWGNLIKALNNFREYFQNFTHELRKAIDLEDYSSCRLKANTLKTEALNVAALDISVAARILEDACSDTNKERIIQTIPAIENYLNVVFGSINRLSCRKNIQSQQFKAVGMQFEVEDIKYEISNIITQLEKNIENADPVYINKQFKLLKEKLPDNFKKENQPLIDELETLIVLYKFDEAYESLKRLTVLLKNEFNNE